MIPTPYRIDEFRYKIFFSGRDSENRSHIGWSMVDIRQPDTIIDVSEEPVLTLGRLGCFDDNGVTPSCVVDIQGRTHLYYIGWNPGSTVRMHLFGGLAISDDAGKTFTRQSEAPLLERVKPDPLLNTAPFVIQDIDHFKMYYVSGVEWIHRDLPRYHIKVATSKDGIHWIREGRVAIDFKDENENALARPYVLRESDGYHMWFAYKGDSYRLAYAYSNDGFAWQRHDDLVGVKPSLQGWDSEMLEYACIINAGNHYIMYYNGNNYGWGGFGLAIGNKRN
jgi:predicted GH43/DUF377 family glycosyl hydrolase